MKLIAATAVFSLASVIAGIPIGQTIIPETLSIYHGYNGRIEYNVGTGKVSRVQNGNDDISTLVTFNFPEATRGRKCELKFERDDGYPTSSPSIIDAFTSSQIATGPSPGWGPPSNYRDVQLGRLRVPTSGQATVDWGNFVFDCPAGQKKGYEFAPTGDSTYLEWSKSTDGPYIRYY
ncbi:uncharacterized protein EI97DRAFT_37946 [Westerdykella ornata]|uniref:Ubiquitin 3 binding protein But2 C-terminal domain-containing protein n=1 Tax=Westerdykella ornata TaxID=318751 RepID=A0A6A6JK96_WESOR|nr:uncharacterized protein EI97DRAFT_37946 [Westerdykella ornata]KAF2276388.1 hypothetical protein EI97DRAFT_37946 [Westerdykella ornata]